MPRKASPEVEKYDLVLVKWLDAAGARAREHSDPVQCLSVGWVVEVAKKEGKQYLKLAAELLEEDDGSWDTLEHVSIPSGMIQQLVRIRRRMPAPFDKKRDA